MSATKDGHVEVDQDTGRLYTWIAGVRVEIVTLEHCERATFIVCGDLSFFADDVRTLCAFCARKIVHRPYLPKVTPKICMKCMGSIASRRES